MQSKSLFKAFGLALLAALGLMAIGAVGAQAEKLAKPYTAGAVLIEGKELHAFVTGKADGATTLLIPALSVEIVCPEFKVLAGLWTGSGGHGTVEILYEKCHAFEIDGADKLGDLLPCQFLDSSSGTVGHIRARALVLVVLHVKLPSTKETYLIFEQIGEEPVKLIHNTTGLGCPLPAKQKMTGSFAFEVVTGDLHTGSAVTEPLITALLHSAELFSAEMKYGVSPVILHSSAFLALAGQHLGKTWGFH